MNRFLIVGNPNTGKTTLFNTLTGAKERTANYSGVTVKEKVEKVSYNGKELEFVDLPGVYSLSSVSDDEVVTKKYLDANKDKPIVFVCSAGEIKKNMILLTDLINNNHKIMVVVNKLGGKIEEKIVEHAKEVLKVPILQTDVRKKKNEILDWISSTIATEVEEKINLNKILSLFPTDKKSIEKLDKILLNPLWGKIIFLAVFIGVLVVSYGSVGTSLSLYVQNWIIKGGDVVGAYIKSWGIVALESFWLNVIVGAVGTVIVYLPQLALMLSLLFVLEEVGYLPRVASLFNFHLEKAGMNGKSIFSLIMGVGCTTSGLLVTRNIGSKKARITTAKFLPFIGCSAKLPIMIYISQILLGGSSLLSIVLIYLTSMVIGVCYVNITKVKGKLDEFFIAEIPKLKIPSLANAIKQSLIIVFDLFKKIVMTVFVSTCIIWLLLNITPNFKFFSGETSILEYVAKYISYLFVPLGLNRVDIVLALISGLLAKENIVSTLGLFGDLSTFSSVQAMTFLIFVMLYSPCIPAIKCAKCEFGKDFAFRMFGVQMLIAYISAFVFSTFARLSMLLGFIMLIVLGVLIIFISSTLKEKTSKKDKIFFHSA